MDVQGRRITNSLMSLWKKWAREVTRTRSVDFRDDGIFIVWYQLFDITLCYPKYFMDTP